MPKPKKERAKLYKKRKKRKQFGGRKERLAMKNKALEEQVKTSTKCVNLLEHSNSILRRRLSKVHLVAAVTKRLTSTYDFCTKPSVNDQEICFSQQLFQSIRQVPYSALTIEKQPFGKGVFGKCFSALMSVHIKVCVKAFRCDKEFVSTFPKEAVMTSILCHPNVPWLYGTTEHEGRKMLILSFHGVGGRSCTIHRALHYDPKYVGFDVSMIDWRIMVYDMVSALKYLHDHDILHNDIKSDNIVIDDKCATLHCVLIDFGKSCFAVDGKSYKLSPEERRRYSLEHPQVAPDLRDGRCKQSKFSDVYSIGRVIKQINDKFLKIPLVASHGSMCTQYNGSKRPTTDELYTTIRNLFKM